MEDVTERTVVGDGALKVVLAIAMATIFVTQISIVTRPELQFRSDAEDLYNTARILAANGAYDQAIHLFEQVAEGAEHTSMAPTASYEAANLYLRRKFEMYLAREALNKTVKFTGSHAAEKAAADLAFMEKHWGADGSPLRLWYRASEAGKANQTSQALAYLEPLCGDSPVVSLRPLALYQKGRLLLAGGRRDEARKALQFLVETYPDHEYAERARPLLKSGS